MKIALLQDDFPPLHEGGAGVIAYQLAKGYARAGHEVLVITTVRKKEDAGESKIDEFTRIRIASNYHVRWRGYRSIYNPRVVVQVHGILNTWKPDVVHVHSVHTHLSYASIVAARACTDRVIMTEHDTMSFYWGKLPNETDPSRPIDSGDSLIRVPWFKQLRAHSWRYNPLREVIIRIILRSCIDRSIAVSEALKRALSNAGLPGALVIHNGIDVSAWKEPPNLSSFIEEHAIGPHAILFGGRLSGAKGALQAVEALARVRVAVPDAQLLIVGKKDVYADRIEQRARELGVSEALVWVGWLAGDNLRAAFYAAAVVTVPSLYLDPFPTVNLEAHACKKPVVATCFGGSPELVIDGVTGFVVNPLDTNRLSQRLIELLQDERLRRSYGEAGCARVQKELLSTIR